MVQTWPACESGIDWGQMKSLTLLLLAAFLAPLAHADEPVPAVKTRGMILDMFEKAEEAKKEKEKSPSEPLTRSFFPDAGAKKTTTRAALKTGLSDAEMTSMSGSRGMTVKRVDAETAKVAVEVMPSSAQQFNNILFELDSTVFANDVAYQQLGEIAFAMKAKPNLEFLVEGHTCDLGTETHNFQLSEARANAVREYLIQQGVSPSQIVTLGFGESDPKVQNLDEANRRLNRRVVVYVRD